MSAEDIRQIRRLQRRRLFKRRRKIGSQTYVTVTWIDVTLLETMVDREMVKAFVDEESEAEFQRIADTYKEIMGDREPADYNTCGRHSSETGKRIADTHKKVINDLDNDHSR